MRPIHWSLNQIARIKCMRNPEIEIADSAKVNYRAIRHLAGSKISIGGRSIVEGQIICDRPGAIVRIGENTFVGSSTLVSADSIQIGDDVLISWGCHLVDHDSHSLSWTLRSKDVLNWYHGRKDWNYVLHKPIVIKNKCWIGFNAIILKGVTLHEGAVVGSGSIVTRDVPPWTVVAGNPAKLIREIPLEQR